MLCYRFAWLNADPNPALSKMVNPDPDSEAQIFFYVCAAPAELFFIERGCLSKKEI
jgi:hypothetical protein